MISLTDTIVQLLNTNVSFPNLLKQREIWNQIDAQNIIKAAINNLKAKRNINLQHVEAFEGE